MNVSSAILLGALSAAGLVGFQAAATPFVIGGLAYAPTGPTETVIAPFNLTSGGLSVQAYSGLVLLTVSGTGASEGSTVGDAFYRGFVAPAHDANHYQLVVTTDASVVVNNDDDAYRHIVYDVDAGLEVSKPYTPAYRSDHVYQFVLDLSAQSPATPAQLRFGVNDGSYGDNVGGDGAYTIRITQLSAAPASTPVPDSGSWLTTATLPGLLAFGWWRRAVRR
jgi:hypothetical protein